MCIGDNAHECLTESFIEVAAQFITDDHVRCLVAFAWPSLKVSHTDGVVAEHFMNRQSDFGFDRSKYHLHGH